MSILYKFTFKNGKSYIGITTTSMARRLSLHLSHAKTEIRGALQRAIRKYGNDSFSIEILKSGDYSILELCKMEKRAILEHGTLLPNGYNTTLGGEGAFGIVVTEAQRKARSERMKGKFIGERWSFGRKHTEESKRKIGDAARGAIFTQDRRDKIGASKKGNTYNLGKACSEATKMKISIAQKGRPLSEAHRAALTGIKKGRPWSEARRLAHERKKNAIDTAS